MNFLVFCDRSSGVRHYAFSKISLGKRGPFRAVDIKDDFLYSDIYY